MRHLIYIATAILLIGSCKKHNDVYERFSEKELAFISYAQGQIIKFIDTSSVTCIMQQGTFARGFSEMPGFWGGHSGSFSETYKTSYYAVTGNGLYLEVDMFHLSRPALTIDFCNYAARATPDSLPPPIPSISINGTTYSNVYTLKAYKNNVPLNTTTDTATLYHNQQFGIIQLLFPNGKRIIRTD